MGPLQDINETWVRFWNDANPFAAFMKRCWKGVVAVSVLVVIPCFWHARIEAGDLGSHIYNAWLAQLVGKGQAPGLYIAHQWSNILFDVTLLYVANIVGFAAAQKIVISICVLIFFWGVFALMSAVTGRAPWYLLPCILILTYGYSFEMGFMNYCLSIGIACFCLALFWSGKGDGWIGGVILAPLVFIAHPIGFLWLVGTLVYISIRRRIPGLWKILLPSVALVAMYGVHWYLVHRANFEIDWEKIPFYLSNGADQLPLYGDRYVTLGWVALFFGTACFAFGVLADWREKEIWKALVLPLELYLVAIFTTTMLPENMRTPMYAGWIGLLVSRLTTITAILGLCVVASLKPRRWFLAGFGAIAVVFFVYLYQDTGGLNRMEANAEKITSVLPKGARVIPTIAAPEDSRVQFIGHTVDRACIRHCFTYSNYEPSSGQFRVRVKPGSPVARYSAEDAEDMEGGSYEFDENDLPLKQIYQCDEADRTRLCVRDLLAGETASDFGHPRPAAQKPPSPDR